MIRALPILFSVFLLWNYAAPTNQTVFFRVYQQDVRVPEPYWTNRAGRWEIHSDVVTTDWLTNGWRLVGSTWDTNFVLAQTNDSAVLHAFTVTAVDANTGIESEPATK